MYEKPKRHGVFRTPPEYAKEIPEQWNQLREKHGTHAWIGCTRRR